MSSLQANSVDTASEGRPLLTAHIDPAVLEDYEAIADVVEVYLNAARSGDPSGLRGLFQDHARVVGMVDGQSVASTPDDFADWVQAGGNSPSLRATIVSIDLSGSAARVSVEISDWLGFRFTDFFLLTQTDGAWRFSSKVFDAHDRNYSAEHCAVQADPLAGADAIAAVVRTYIDGARSGDGTALRGIWFDHAHIVGSFDGAPVNRTADAFSAKVAAAGGAPKLRGRLVAIDQSGPAASARIEIEAWDGVRYTDFFTLFRAEGAWRVAGKVFDAHERR